MSTNLEMTDDYCENQWLIKFVVRTGTQGIPHQWFNKKWKQRTT